MATICAWCDKPMGEAFAMIEGTSYGICGECLEIVVAKYVAEDDERADFPGETCPLCDGTGEGKPVPAVTVGEPQDREYPPCEQCGGKGYVVVDTESEEVHHGGDAIREGDQAESEAATGFIRD